MAQNLQSFNSSRLLQLAASVNNVSVSLHDHRALSKQVAKVIVSLSTDRCTSAEVASAITRCLGDEFSPVLNSFRPVPGARCIALAGYVTRNTEVIAITDERFKRMRTVTANIMLDPQDSSMWDIRKTENDGVFLVRAGEEDLGNLLVTASVRDVNAPRMAEMASCSTPGEFVAFVDPQQGELRHGFVLASDGDTVDIVTADAEQPVQVGENAIVEAALLHGEDVEVAATVGIDSSQYDSRSKSAMTEYYKQLYSYAPAFVDDIVKQIDAHAAV